MKKSIEFMVYTCIASWIIAGIAILFGLRIDNMIAYTIFGAIYMLMPTICALMLQKKYNEKPFSNLRVSLKLNWWFIIAGITPIIYAFLTIAINLLFPNVSFSITMEGFIASLPVEVAETAAQQLSQFPPVVFVLIQTFSAIIAGYTINAVFAFGEELGWRGYLLRELKVKKFLFVSLVTGIIWGLWHFPLILLGHNYPQHPVIGVGMMIIWCILLSPVITYITIKSKSVFTAAIFHGSLNAIAGIGTLFIVGGNDLINGATGIAGFITLIFINIIFVLYDKFIAKENIFTNIIEQNL